MTVPSILLPAAVAFSTKPEDRTIVDAAPCRASLLPYPDVFDLSMYDYRASRDSCYNDVWDHPSQCKPAVDAQTGEAPRPLTVSYDSERDRNRSVNTVTLRTVKRFADLPPPSALPAPSQTPSPCEAHEDADDTDEGSITAQMLAACKDLSRCDWTEEEFLRLFSSPS